MMLRDGLPPPPPRLAKLPLDDRGFPVPFFVAWMDGKPDFRVMDSRKWVQCVRFERCWLCGEQLGRLRTFVIGPMCAVNRTSAEPPSHHGCAEFAARACPFLAMPKMRRREAGLPEEVYVSGIQIPRNPGVALLWTMKGRPEVFQAPRSDAGPDGWLIKVGEPVKVEWYAEGRPATRAEVLESFESGCPALMDLATTEGPEAVAALQAAQERALAFLPT